MNSPYPKHMLDLKGLDFEQLLEAYTHWVQFVESDEFFQMPTHHLAHFEAVMAALQHIISQAQQKEIFKSQTLKVNAC